MKVMEVATGWRTCVGVMVGLLGMWVGWARDGFVEMFDTDPAARGWVVEGEGTLFGWDAAGQRLGVTWDSSRTNSFFVRRLPAPVGVADDFVFGFDLELEEHAVGVDPKRPGTFQIAVGLLRLSEATAPGFQRGVFLRSSNLVEWTWFGPDPSGTISASVSPVVVPRDGRLPWGYRDSYLGLEIGLRYGFEYRYTATNRTLRGTVTVDGQPGPELAPVVLPAAFTGFHVDALSVNSYSDAGQDPRYAGSVLARGWIRRMHYEGPGAVTERVEVKGDAMGWRLSVPTRVGWRYQLQHSPDLRSWEAIGEEQPGTGGEVGFDLLNALDLPAGFFQMRAYLP
jgi:hypothetical protein